jgi:4-diphosphocytidyl-2-C-methyl-D-erythritol kinase
MLIRHQGGLVRVWTPAKVNLFLEVLRRRPDGYHDLATLMVTVGLYDTLEFHDSPAGPIALTCDLPGLATGPDNLVWRAAELFRQHTGIGRGVRIHLRKRTPLAAGLAGGSSDAAATLAGLNRLWRRGLNRTELASLGARLGSDVAFFFRGPAAWCTGRGEIVEPVRPGLTLHLLLAFPPVGLATPAVFQALTVPARPREGTEVRSAFVAGNHQALAAGLFNRLEEPALVLCPTLARLRQRLAEHNPAAVLMSGSGTTVFALCRGPSEAHRMARALGSIREGGDLARVCVVRSCD